VRIKGDGLPRPGSLGGRANYEADTIPVSQALHSDGG
jgi:hypothetical protein